MNFRQFFSKNKFILISLRAISVLAKFLFTILYFRISESDFGEYNLVAVSILLGVYLLGLDFYSYANRNLLEKNSNHQKIIFNQFIFYILLYFILFPLFFYAFKLLKFNPEYFGVFLAVLIMEHLNFELYRLFLILKKPIIANINLFLRNGLWVLFAIYIMFTQNHINIKTVLYLWLAGNILALLFSIFSFLLKQDKISKNNLKIDLHWIKKGLIVSFPYILGTISYKTVEFADRYMINAFLDKKSVGVYSFFANIANVMNIVIFTLVVSVLYPYIIEGIIQRNQEKLQKYYKQFKKETFFYSLIMIILLSILLPIILIFINKTQYIKDFYIFLILAFSNILLNFSFLYHYILYAEKKDWTLFIISFGSALINIFLNYLFIPIMGIAGAAIATLLSFSWILFFKYLHYKKIK